jgi:hypothetical protein
MKYVPSLPPLVNGVADSLDVYALSRVKSAKPVRDRTLVPLVVHRQMHLEHPPSEIAEHKERRNDSHVQGDRRTYSRRIDHPSLLVELRSRMERRRRKKRMSDTAKHVDEEV